MNHHFMAGQEITFTKSLYDHWQRRAARFLLWTRMTCSGVGQIPESGPAMLTPNHLNWKDIFVVSAMIARPICFAATKELFDTALCRKMLDCYFDQYIHKPILHRMIHWFNVRLAHFLVSRVTNSGAFPVKRSAHDRSFFAEAKVSLRRHRLVCIFPESGTEVPDRLRSFKLGAAKVVHDLYYEGMRRIPVFPAGICGTKRLYCPAMRIKFQVASPLFIDDFMQNSEKKTLNEFTCALRYAVASMIDYS